MYIWYKLVNCNGWYLIFTHLFQYNCCLRYHIRTEWTAHIFSHYINIDMKQFCERIKQFVLQNLGWIQKVGRDVLVRSQLTSDAFVKGLVAGTILFDELCLTVACRAFNIHCVVLLNGSFWTTHPNNQLHHCLLCLAYVWDYEFKEICAETTAIIDEQATEEYTYDSSDEDLTGTGILYDNDQTDIESSQNKVHRTKHHMISFRMHRIQLTLMWNSYQVQA